MPAFDSMVTRLPRGFTNANQFQTLGDYGLPDPSWACQYFNDFLTTASVSELTTTLTGSATSAGLQNGYDGGATRYSTTALANDAVWAQLPSVTFQPELGKFMFFKLNAKLSTTVTTADMMSFGFTSSGATSIGAVTNGIYFSTNSNSVSNPQLTFTVRSGGTNVYQATVPGSLLPAGTAFEVGIEIDDQGNICAYFNPTTGRTNAQNAQPKGYVMQTPYLSTMSTLFAAPLTPFVTVNNQLSAAARNLDVDYIFAAKHR